VTPSVPALEVEGAVSEGFGEALPDLERARGFGSPFEALDDFSGFSGSSSFFFTLREEEIPDAFASSRSAAVLERAR
jgi:hypothetical protein